MNRLRTILANRIEDNGGYVRSWHGRYALSWTVSLLPDLSLEHIHNLTGDPRPVPEEIANDWDESELWSWAQEDAYRNLQDDCWLRSPGVKEATKWGFEYFSPMKSIGQRYKRKENECVYYPAPRPGWILVKPYTNIQFDAKFELLGRGGKHVTLVEFEGVRLDKRSDELAVEILEDDCGDYTNLWCRKLLMMMDVWDEALTSERAEAEAEYQASERLKMEMDEWYSENSEREYWESRDVVTED